MTRSIRQPSDDGADDPDMPSVGGSETAGTSVSAKMLCDGVVVVPVVVELVVVDVWVVLELVVVELVVVEVVELVVELVLELVVVDVSVVVVVSPTHAPR